MDGANPGQIYLAHLPSPNGAGAGRGRHLCAAARLERISLPFLLLSSIRSLTVPVALAKFLNSDEAPWNYLMAASIIYALPPLVIYYASAAI